MSNKTKVLIPAGGSATRLGGIPKFFLPLNNDSFLLKNHIDNLNNISDVEIIVGINEKFSESINDLFQNIKIKTVDSHSMLDTVTQLELSQENNSIVIMPDTYFSDYEIVKKVINRLEISNNDIVLGVWHIEESQKGKLGQCVISNDKVTRIIDKDKNCNEELFWGLIAWKPTFTKFIKSEDSHFGISINRAIENNLSVGFLISDSQYYDCGTFSEYKYMLDNISN